MISVTDIEVLKKLFRSGLQGTMVNAFFIWETGSTNRARALLLIKSAISANARPEGAW